MSGLTAWRAARGLAVLAALGGLGALGVALRPWPAPHLPGPVAAIAPPASAPLALGALDTALALRDPFRPARRPAAAVYDPAPAPVVPPEPPPPKPALVLTGLLWGPAPTAVLEGVPGTDGPRVLAAGDTLGGLRVRRITAHSVLITGMDTTWLLTVRHPW